MYIYPLFFCKGKFKSIQFVSFIPSVKISHLHVLSELNAGQVSFFHWASEKISVYQVSVYQVSLNYLQYF